MHGESIKGNTPNSAPVVLSYFIPHFGELFKEQFIIFRAQVFIIPYFLGEFTQLSIGIITPINDYVEIDAYDAVHARPIP